MMQFTVETEREDDGRWMAEAVQLPGVMKYGRSREEAIELAEALALRVMPTGLRPEDLRRNE